MSQSAVVTVMAPPLSITSIALNRSSVGGESSPYSASWNTASANNGAHALTARAFDAANHQTTSAAVNVTVSNGSATPPILDIASSGVPATIRRGQTFTARGTVANTGGAAASGYTVLVSFTPTDSM